MKSIKRLKKIVHQYLKESFKHDRLDQKRVLNFVKAFKKLSKAQAIYCLTEYLKGLKSIIDKHTLYIESVTPLSKLEVSQVKKFITKDHQAAVVKIATAFSLLGGLRIKIGDTILDSSISTKIEKIGEMIHG